MSRVLFFGRQDCSYSDDAFKHLVELGFEVRYIKSNHRNEDLSDDIKEWNDDNIDSLLKKTHAELFKLFQRITKGLFLNKDNFLNKKLNAEKNEKWNGSAKKLSELNKFQFIDSKITSDELARRIRAFHTNDYPLKIKLHGYVFLLKK